MEISRKTDYALRMLAELIRQPDCIVSVRTAAKENEIPYSFARAIQHDLTIAGIIESVRGAHGGMKLSVDPAAMTLLDVVEAIQGPVHFAECETLEGDDQCPCYDACKFAPVWCNAARILRAYFASVTLNDIVVDGLMPDIETAFSLVPSGR